MLSKKQDLYLLILFGTIMSACSSVGVDSDPSWTNGGDTGMGGKTSAAIIVVKASVSIPSTTLASISKAVTDVPASGYQAVVVNFTTGEIVGTGTIASDGSTEVF